MTGLCEGMVDAALCAAEVILDIYESDFSVDVKEDSSPVTRADRVAEKVILSRLANLAPDIPVVAEEAVSEGRIPQIPDVFFLVDPVDGTREFVRRNGEFTVNIALVRNQCAEIGVIYTPCKGWLYCGEVGKGAWRADVPDPRKSHALQNRRAISVRTRKGQLEVVGSRSHQTPETEAFNRSVGATSCKSIGSSLKFCLLASGEADLYPRFGPTMEWDTAAGDAILTAAGGIVETLEGKRLCYGKVIQDGIPFANPHFIAKGEAD